MLATPDLTLDGELAEFRRQYVAAREDGQTVAGDLSPHQFRWNPVPGRWSIGQCLDHLNNGWGVLPRIDRAMARAREQGLTGSGPFRRGVFASLYIRAVEPPVRLRFPAPRRFRPRPDPPPAEVLPRFAGLQDEMIARVEAARGLDLSRIRLSSPILRSFKMSLAEWFAFLVAHERRHLWQAWNVRRHPEFPAC
jgi:hypothetical protein